MESLAIIGSGIAGMGAAHFLQHDYDITIFEKESYVGGHTNTLFVSEEGEEVAIDSGFMVFNHVTYPNLVRLFKELDVPTKKTCMSFSVKDSPGKLEYCGSGLNGLFRQRRNILRPRFIKMLLSINRFNQDAIDILNDPNYDDVTIEELVEERAYGDDFFDKYLVPMSGAVWSTPPDKMRGFPAKTLIRFFYNHGFLGLNTQHQWYTMEGGSESYKSRLIDPFKERIKLNQNIATVRRSNGKVKLGFKDGSHRIFDKVLFSCHGDQALKLIESPNQQQEQLLSPFKYQKNHVLLHTDRKVMPKIKGVWSSWNYRMEMNHRQEVIPSTIYWMNRLQGISKKTDYFISLNDTGIIDDHKVLREIYYEHPLFDQAAVRAQQELQQLNQDDEPFYFCGAYFRYGFHEDGFQSAINVSEKLLGRPAW
ncbi:NAD(P)/FAD-dependent oxidoreductase [Pseudobacteriovorax antillogorgiicola]|uniref:Predicted NAD/FAD-binding protein n=1 Tax=Pseudobacteriovorax antillogorgiicola TaxID=1513793 RepID=A0A1Y6CHF3_9BACT|nr:FAD-dependent oxidoreductase [Pseudobacteriovorax antillogorgiicola]TCS48990.1 putative NAD/FAD-binding protein [Pseudobacteriovorax antillogorgiicola]SMF53419.1 Predicted NAD/FAD-binding protein [Pseudobacteriovorax antillogorgiicola]